MNTEKPDTALIRELADFIETVPKHQFFFGAWLKGLKKFLKIGAPVGCETTGCGLGWATVLPKFKAKGLHWNFGNTPAVDGNTDLEYIGRKLFGISVRYTNRLFMPSTKLGEDCTPKEWAANARAVADEVDAKYNQKHAASTPAMSPAWAGNQAPSATENPASLASS